MTTAARPLRLSVWRGVFYALMALGIVLTYIRFTQGLGAVSNMSDRYPWGLWIGFDLLCGVGLAAGGFVVTAAVYIFDLERFKPIVRPAILTAFLGYLLVCLALVFDLGRPWNIWHPLIMWNPQSVMFEVAWCVMLYSTVLTLEFSGMVFERLGWTKLVRYQHALTFPLVIVGVVLSTLHQSSLGTVYLIVPGKLHALWYTPLLPVIFFVSAVTVGLAMVIVESRLSSRALGRQLEMPLLSSVGHILSGLLILLVGLRFFDFWNCGQLATLFDFSYESRLALLELGPLLILPMFLLASPRVRNNTRWLYGAALLVVAGFIVNRLNVAITAFESATGGHYVPSFAEVGITLFIVALGFGAFTLAAKHLPVYPDEEKEEASSAVVTPPTAHAEAPNQRRRIAIPTS